MGDMPRRMEATVKHEGKGKTAERGQHTEKKGGRKQWIRILSIALSVLLVCCVGAVFWLYRIYRGINDNPLSVLVKDNTAHTTTVVDDSGKQANYVTQEHLVNILLLGIDSNEERVSWNMGYRSDVMILCSLDFDSKTMTMMSIPRDTYVPMNKLDYKTGAVKSRTKNKINAAYAFGGGPQHFGEKNAVDCVKEFLSCNGKLDIAVDYYASIDMDGIPKLVDAVGGVQVVLDRTIDELGKKGETITINSSNVDTYVRKRKQDGGGDPGRNDRQQALLVALAKKIKSMGAINAATSLYNDATQYIKTNVSLEEALAFATFLQGFDVDSGITQYRVEVTSKTMNGTYYEIANEKALYNFVLSHFYRPEA